MTLTLVMLDNNENFLQFLDTELVEIEETYEKGGLRTLNIEYTFQDFQEDKKLFSIGNKLWVSGDKQLTDCLYVINTEVKEDVFGENRFTLELEEVLVELNYAPLFTQLELSKKDSSNNPLFKTGSTNGQAWVKVNWNALNYWFGQYFNIGVVQDTLTTYGANITIAGSINLMSLLRLIEEETGNIFITRYEKDCLNNTIHRYLDFLNPINVNKAWYCHLEYDFVNTDNISICYDADGNPIPDTPDWDVTAFDDGVPEESIPENDDTYVWSKGTEKAEQNTNPTDEDWEFDITQDYTPSINLDPSITAFIISDGENILDTDGKPTTLNDENALLWNAEDVGLEDETQVVISLCRVGSNIGITINEKSYAVVGSNYVGKQPCFIQSINDESLDPSNLSITNFPDDSYLEIINIETGKTLYRTMLNTQIGHVHEEVLDFGFNIENVEYNINETETYTSISPVLSLNENSNLTRNHMSNLLTDWLNLSISKGDTVPMILQKVTVDMNNISDSCNSQYPSVLLDKVKCKLGNYNKSSSPERSTSSDTNYWSRPYNPQDKVDTTTPSKSTFEFYRATAYWKAPFSKKAGEFHVSTDAVQDTQYQSIRQRPDTRHDVIDNYPKNGTIETTEEEIYTIYNQVALALKEKQYPKFSINVEVANLKNGKFNDYQLHDKVYLKLPGYTELVTARITKTVKNAKEITKNTVELDNYNVCTIKTIQNNTYITAPNYSFHYPSSSTLKARLVNEDYDNTDQYSIQYPANKLIKIQKYKVENGSRGNLLAMYTKITDKDGYIKLPLKYTPGNYELDLNFGGDEEYFESSHTVKVNVTGQVETQELKNKAKIKTKTTKKSNTTKTNTTTKTVKTYWTKCGLSPDKKHKEIVAVAKPSGPDAYKYPYKLHKTIFKNKCPICGRTGTLRFDAGPGTKCITSTGAYGKGYKASVQAEHEITCIACDSDYCGVTGAEKWYTIRGRLKTLKKPVSSKQSEFNKLKTGKLVYDTNKVTVKKKSVVNNQKRKVIGSDISSKVKKTAESIVGNLTGKKALLAICDWMDKRIWYDSYSEFRRSPSNVISSRRGNCCDQTRTVLQLFDCAGLTEYYKLEYIHVYNHVYARVTNKKTGSYVNIDCASDAHGCYGYVCRDYRTSILGRSTYPKRPF